MSDDEKDRPGESRFQRLRRTASEILDSEVLRGAVEVTKDVASLGLDVTTEAASRGGRAVSSLYHGTRKTITQEEAWEQMEQSINDLTDVVRVQHAMILDLLSRVDRLEAAAKPPASGGAESV
jgi:hypothetical protein